MLLSAKLLIIKLFCIKGFIMKILSNVLFLSLTITSISYAMQNGVENKAQKDTATVDLFFRFNIVQLSSPIADFVHDFKTWPKEDQDKIKTFSNDGARGYTIVGRPAAADKYSNGIGYYLDCRLTQQQILPFLFLIDHLKKQK